MRLLSILVCHIVAVASQTAAGPIREKETFTIRHDPRMQVLSIEWSAGDRVHLLMRVFSKGDDSFSRLVRSQKMPSGLIRPRFLEWSRNSAVREIGIVSASKKLSECDEFPLVLDQNSAALQIDCFFRNIGDSLITFPTRDAEKLDQGGHGGCLDAIDIDVIDGMCKELADFSTAFIRATENPSASLLRNHLVKSSGATYWGNPSDSEGSSSSSDIDDD